MTERERFVTLARTGRFTITELCADFEGKDRLKPELQRGRRVFGVEGERIVVYRILHRKKAYL